jgi:hypothetical protein
MAGCDGWCGRPNFKALSPSQVQDLLNFLRSL